MADGMTSAFQPRSAAPGPQPALAADELQEMQRDDLLPGRRSFMSYLNLLLALVTTASQARP